MALLTLFWGLDGLLLLFFAFIFAYAYVTRNFGYWKRRGIKEKPPWAFVGNFAPCLFGQKSPETFLRGLYFESEGEKLLGYYVLDKPYLLIRDIDLIKHVLVKDFDSFANRLVSASETDTLGNLNLFLVKQPPWRFIRQKVSPFFTTGKLKSMFVHMDEISKELDVYLEKLGVNESTETVVEVSEACSKYTTDLTGIMMFGMMFNSLKNPEAHFRKHGKNITRTTHYRNFEFMSIFFIPQWLSPLGIHFFDNKSSEFFRTAFSETLDERIKAGHTRIDFMDKMIELKDIPESDPNYKDFKLEREVLLAQATLFFLAGFVTTSTTIFFTLYELARNMEVQTKLRNEILKALEENDGQFTYQMVSWLPYLDMVTNEGLRMYPILGFLDRVATKRYKFPDTDLVIEKGQPVSLPIRALHMDPKYFPNPEVFDPERFNAENFPKIPKYAYLPFGEGQRICLGKRLGILISKYGLSYIISKYEITLAEKTRIPVQFEPTALTFPRWGVHLKMRKLS